MVELFANSGDPDQMPHSAFCGIWLDLHCLPVIRLGSPVFNGLKGIGTKAGNQNAQGGRRLWAKASDDFYCPVIVLD